MIRLDDERFGLEPLNLGDKLSPSPSKTPGTKTRPTTRASSKTPDLKSRSVDRLNSTPSGSDGECNSQLTEHQRLSVKLFFSVLQVSPAAPGKMGVAQAQVVKQSATFSHQFSVECIGNKKFMLQFQKNTHTDFEFVK